MQVTNVITSAYDNAMVDRLIHPDLPHSPPFPGQGEPFPAVLRLALWLY